MTTTNEFFNACEAHDWFADFSDDFGKQAKARTEFRRLRGLADDFGGVPAFQAILAAFVLWRDESIANGAATTPPQRANWVPAIPSVETVLHPDQSTIFEQGA